MSQILWSPSAERISNAQITQFQARIEQRFNLKFDSYPEFHRWSAHNIGDFWSEVWDFCGVKSSKSYTEFIANEDQFPGASWFPGAELNFAENLLRFNDDKAALVEIQEKGWRRSLSYTDLHQQVAQLASAMRKLGIQKGDCVAGLLPNVIETTVAMLATSSIGAIWTSCSPDFGVNGICDRFGQTQPKLLICNLGYTYNGKSIDCLDNVLQVQERLDKLIKTVVISNQGEQADISKLNNAVQYDDFLDQNADSITFEQLPFNHPLYINYSSGTTGQPKCIVHGAGGTLLQHLKEHKLHTDVSRDDVLFYFTTCGWMMWNWLVSGLACGATLILFDGSPFAKRGNILLDAIDDEGITIFGTSAKYIAALEKQEKIPRETHKLDTLKSILSTGSPLAAYSYDYVYRDIKEDVCLSSISGGTDILSCFILGNPTIPVCRGEIQCIGLGMAVEMWDDNGKPLQGEKGELVCVKPFPSTPVGFWNDPDQAKFKGAYFEDYPGIWAHGDYGEITASGGVIIHGRSDAVLNPGGVRIGTAEIYRQVEKINSVVDCIAVGQEIDDDVRVVLFVVTKDGVALDDDLKADIKNIIRENTTVRHVPAIILQVDDIPRTISGKIVEVAVKNVIHNRAVKNTDALANPEALELYKNLAELQV